MGQNQPKKLVLNRETVRDLTKDELEGIEGGANGVTKWTGDGIIYPANRVCCVEMTTDICLV